MSGYNFKQRMFPDKDYGIAHRDRRRYYEVPVGILYKKLYCYDHTTKLYETPLYHSAKKPNIINYSNEYLKNPNFITQDYLITQDNYNKYTMLREGVELYDSLYEIGIDTVYLNDSIYYVGETLDHHAIIKDSSCIHAFEKKPFQNKMPCLAYLLGDIFAIKLSHKNWEIYQVTNPRRGVTSMVRAAMGDGTLEAIGIDRNGAFRCLFKLRGDDDTTQHHITPQGPRPDARALFYSSCQAYHFVIYPSSVVNVNQYGVL